MFTNVESSVTKFCDDSLVCRGMLREWKNTAQKKTERRKVLPSFPRIRRDESYLQSLNEMEILENWGICCHPISVY